MGNKVSLNKKYITKEGVEVRLYSTDGGGKYPVHGAYNFKGLQGDSWNVAMWTLEGRFNTSHITAIDLEEVIEYEYHNLYLHKDPPIRYIHHVYATKEEAEKEAAYNRVACLKVKKENTKDE